LELAENLLLFCGAAMSPNGTSLRSLRRKSLGRYRNDFVAKVGDL